MRRPSQEQTLLASNRGQRGTFGPKDLKSGWTLGARSSTFTLIAMCIVDMLLTTMCHGVLNIGGQARHRQRGLRYSIILREQ